LGRRVTCWLNLCPKSLTLCFGLDVVEQRAALPIRHWTDVEVRLWEVALGIASPPADRHLGHASEKLADQPTVQQAVGIVLNELLLG
jgi:hypothetical protein